MLSSWRTSTSSLPYGLVDGPRHDRRGVRPSGPAHGHPFALGRDGGILQDVRHDRGDGAVGVLVELEVAQPGHPERLDVEEGARGRRERLRVARPAEPLVALRAVGRERDEVVALRPSDVRVQALEARVGAFERGSRAVGARDGDGRRRHDLRAGHFGVLEAVERERRLEGGLAVVGEDVPVGRALRCGAPSCGWSRRARAPRRGAPDAVARRAAHDEAEPAGDVLAKVEEGVAVAVLDRHRPFGHRAHPGRDARLHDRRVDADLPGRRPRGVVEARGIPPCGSARRSISTPS
jgi:hypothetical protein